MEENLPFYVKRKEELTETNLDCKDGFCSIAPPKKSSNITSVINKLTYFRERYGEDLEVVQLDFTTQGADVYPIEPCIVSDPNEPNKKLVVFD